MTEIFNAYLSMYIANIMDKWVFWVTEQSQKFKDQLEESRYEYPEEFQKMIIQIVIDIGPEKFLFSDELDHRIISSDYDINDDVMLELKEKTRQSFGPKNDFIDCINDYDKAKKRKK